MLQGPRGRVCQPEPRPQVTLGRGSIHLHPQGPPLAGPPLPGSGTPPKPCGGRAPSGRGCTPALPGEVCKHSCSRAREPLEVRPQGYTTRGRGQEGTDRGRRFPGQQLRRLGDPPPASRGRPHALAPSRERTPARTKISWGAAGNGFPPHPPGRTRPPSRPFSGKGWVPI